MANIAAWLKLVCFQYRGCPDKIKVCFSEKVYLSMCFKQIV